MLLIAVAGLPAAPSSALAQAVGEVIYAQGIATAQRPGEPARFIAKGDALSEGDVLSTSAKGYAVIGMRDGAKMTLRPDTVFAIDRYAHDKGEESAVMRLIRGGFRAVTGLIGKRNPGGVRIQASTATIGIRGTEFDARLCGLECKREAALAAQQPNTEARDIVARVVQLNGPASAVSPQQPARTLAAGAPLYEGDVVRTGQGGVAVLGFKDQTRLSLNPSASVRIDSFSYGARAREDNFALRLLRGSLRAFTGLIGKTQPTAVRYTTSVATIGIRGTGMDMSCEGPCAEEPSGPAPADGNGLVVFTWDGMVLVSACPPERACDAEVEVPVDKAVFVDGKGNLRTQISVPEFLRAIQAPRPDGVQVNWEELFGIQGSGDEQGLYVTVRDGKVFLSATSSIELNPGDAAQLLEGSDKPQRLSEIPLILRNDPFPIPSRFDERNARVLQLFGTSTGRPGQELCEMQ